MKFIPTKIPGVLIIEPKVFGDSRGFFCETYRQKLFSKNGIRARFVQDNHSRSAKGVIRAFHYQAPPRAQAKLVRVIRGSVFDVVVDLRKGSKTYGRHVGEILSAENKKMIYIPEGFAHGFLALEDNTEVLYKTTDYYSPKHERGILWNDPALKIKWPVLNTPYLLSPKDARNPTLFDALKK